ncbi:hypothetical protein KFE25_002645 [Diacronema lutheri]|uniref:Aluminum resistance protein n=1 Tax=Diacronema lutheri TaxID=2081491 RepID=A0A8J6CF73_DIALT|nr:hypothetical protein KFE25_002645 [Diacronema lutheri]
MIAALLAAGTAVLAAKPPAYAPATTAPSALVRNARADLAPLFDNIDWQTRTHVARVLDAFRNAQVSSSDFGGVDGYGHGDIGREKLDAIYAELFGAEAALVRIQCFSGTHAIACCLYGVLRPGDTLLTVSGQPYDTLEEVIGTRGAAVGTPGDSAAAGLTGSLMEFGVRWEQVALLPDGKFDYAAIREALERPRDGRVAMVHVQRSCGYQWRRSIPVREIGEFADWLADWRAERDGAPRPASAAPGRGSAGAEPWQPSWPVLFVDNCYGEFVEKCEPTALGADLIAGSLIKNPGGTLAPTGGYVAGRAQLVQAASNRLSAPGVEGGATLGQNRLLLQGLFHAPQVVGEALKGATLAARVFAERGFACKPHALTPRADIVQCIQLGTRRNLLDFCEVVQRYSPVSAHVRPIAGVSPGYGDEVVFADGTFIEGSTAELSADGPLREPYAVYMQGGNHWTQWAIILDAFFARLEQRQANA